MRATEAYTTLLQLSRPVVATAEAAARLGISDMYASKLLARLARDGLILRLRRGLWAVTTQVNPYILPPYLTAPYPSYISAWTALYHHGLIDQIPQQIYVVSLDRSKRIKTPVAVFVVRHISPTLFEGYTARDGVLMATPEKALFDAVYLASALGKQHAFFPEVEIPKRLKRHQVRRWVRRISSPRIRVLVESKIESILGSVGRRPSMR